MDCQSKMSDNADKYNINVKIINSLKKINKFTTPDDKSYDWSNSKMRKVKGKKICNFLIHSYLFILSENEFGVVNGFFVSSDYDHDKFLYEVSLVDWIEYINFISNDDIVKMIAKYDQSDYIFTKKKRNFKF